jgi:hypothetical protein
MNLYLCGDATPQDHPVLIPVSGGYPRALDTFHTRYAPVRRSPAAEAPLPLDLHVLGLPLAFILSQDQTLHCIWISNSKMSLNYCLPVTGDSSAPRPFPQ